MSGSTPLSCAAMTERDPSLHAPGDAPGAGRPWLVWVGAALPMVILPIVIVTIPVAAAESMALTSDELASWIVALYAIPCVLSLAFAVRYRQPLLFTGNVFYLIFIARLGSEVAFAELVGASLIAGVVILAVVMTGVSKQLASLVPAPVVLGLLAGAVLPFVVDLFTLLGVKPLAVGGMTLAYGLGHRFLPARVPPILPAFLAAIILAPATGNVGALPTGTPAVSVTVFAPRFTVDAIATVTPVLVVLILLQSNLPSVVFLRSEGYDPPERTLGTVSGVGTAVASLLGPTGISLSLPATSFVAGPVAGPRAKRFIVVAIASVVLLGFTLFARVAAELPNIVSVDLLFALAGLAVIGVLSHALRAVVSGPLTLGPLFAFAIALSEFTALGLSSFFWALVIGTAVSQVIERERLTSSD
jgi:benzoate membrane transport protein